MLYLYVDPARKKYRVVNENGNMLNAPLLRIKRRDRKRHIGNASGFTLIPLEETSPPQRGKFDAYNGNGATPPTPSVSSTSVFWTFATMTLVLGLAGAYGFTAYNNQLTNRNTRNIANVNETACDKFMLLQGEIELLENEISMLSNTSEASLLLDIMELNETKISTLSGVSPEPISHNVDLDAGLGIVVTPDTLSYSVAIAADTTYVQRRVSGTCPAGQSIQVVNADGTVVCETSGDVSSSAGSSVDNALVRMDGTSGTLIQSSVVLLDDAGSLSGIANIALSGTVDGRDVAADGTTLDNHIADTDIHVAHTNVTITGDSENAYITGGGDISASRTLDIDTDKIQRRVTEVCTATQAMIEINSDGTATCQETGTVTSNSESSVDNAVVRFHSTTGQVIQTSVAVLDDTGNLSGLNDITLSGTVDGRDVAADGALLDSHVADLTIHRAMDDTVTSDTTLWSSEKITTELNMINTTVDQNTVDIATNTGDIATNAADITTLQRQGLLIFAGKIEHTNPAQPDTAVITTNYVFEGSFASNTWTAPSAMVVLVQYSWYGGFNTACEVCGGFGTNMLLKVNDVTQGFIAEARNSVWGASSAAGTQMLTLAASDDVRLEWEGNGLVAGTYGGSFTIYVLERL